VKESGRLIMCGT